MAKIDTFSDPLDSLNPATWATTNTGGASVAGAGGAAVFTITGVSGSCRLDSVATFDIGDSSVYFEVFDRTISTGFDLAVLDAAGNGFGARITFGGALQAGKWTAGAFAAWFTVGTWDAALHRFIRLRRAGTTIELDTSPDGTTWTNRTGGSDTHAAPDYAAVAIAMFTSTSSSAGSIKVGGVNTAGAAAAPSLRPLGLTGGFQVLTGGLS